jgi:hypothetical protein
MASCEASTAVPTVNLKDNGLQGGLRGEAGQWGWVGALLGLGWRGMGRMAVRGGAPVGAGGSGVRWCGGGRGWAGVGVGVCGGAGWLAGGWVARPMCQPCLNELGSPTRMNWVPALVARIRGAGEGTRGAVSAMASDLEEWPILPRSCRRAGHTPSQRALGRDPRCPTLHLIDATVTGVRRPTRARAPVVAVSASGASPSPSKGMARLATRFSTARSK